MAPVIMSAACVEIMQLPQSQTAITQAQSVAPVIMSAACADIIELIVQSHFAIMTAINTAEMLLLIMEVQFSM